MKNGKKLFSILLCIALIAGNFVSAGFVRAEDVAPDEQPEQQEQQAQNEESAEQTAEQEIGENQEAQSQELSQQNEPSEQQTEDVEQVNPQGGQNNSTDDENDKDVETGNEGEVQENVEPGTEDEVKQDVELKNEDEVKQNDEPGTEDEVQENFEAGTLTLEENEYSVTLTYGADAKIPSDATLSVQEISNKTAEYENYLAKAATKIFEEEDTDATTLPYARFFDITILDKEGEKIEPSSPVNVQIDLKDDATQTEEVTFAAVHFVEVEKTEAQTENTEAQVENTEAQEAQTEAQTEAKVEPQIIEVSTVNEGTTDAESTVSFDADGFSVYGVFYYYTVDFYYTAADGTKAEYHMNGSSEMMMSELFGKLGIEKDAADISAVEFTDESLVTFTKTGSDYTIKSLKPFTTGEMLTITFSDGEVISIIVEDEIASGTFGSNLKWSIDDEGHFILEPASGSNGTITSQYSSATESGGATPRTSGRTLWPWEAYKDKIITAEIKGEIRTYGGDNNWQLQGMFDWCTNMISVDVSGLNTSRVGDVSFFFANCPKLKTITGMEAWTESVHQNDGNKYGVENIRSIASMFRNSTALEEVDLSFWTSNGKIKNFQNMCTGCTSLKKFTLNNPNFKTDPGSQWHTGSNGPFQGCNALETVDMSNITVSTNNNGLKEMFAGLSSLKEVTMKDMDFRGVKSLEDMFNNCQSLETLTFAPKEGAKFGEVFPGGSQTNMDGLFKNCPKLKTLDITNLDNSELSYNHELGFEDLDSLTTLKADNSNVWIDKNGANYTDMENVNMARDIDFIQNATFDYTPSPVDPDYAGSTPLTIDSAEVIELVVKDGTSKDTIGYTNTNDKGMLSPGTYVRTSDIVDSDMEVPLTYYIIDGMDENAPIIEVLVGTEWKKWDSSVNPDYGYNIDELGDYYFYSYQTTGGTDTRIFTKPKTNAEWKNGTDANDSYKYEGTPIRITYPNSATSINGTKHDVVITINSISFENMSRIPNTTDDTYTNYDADFNPEVIANPWGPDSFRPDKNKIPGGPGNENSRRYLLNAGVGELRFWNQVTKETVSGGTSTDPFAVTPSFLYSKGSGTNIDFNLNISGAEDGQSVLYWCDDLDMPENESWSMPSVNPNDDVRNAVNYAPGAEGIALGEGNDLSSVTIANRTYLKLYNYADGTAKDAIETDGSIQGNNDINTAGVANYLIGSRPDPETLKTRFYVKSNATGSNYVWTTGTSCETTVLKSTSFDRADILDVHVNAKANKTVNESTPPANLDRVFEFVMTPASDITNVTVNGNTVANNAGKAFPNPIEIKNAGGSVDFGKMTFLAPGANFVDTGKRDPVYALYKVYTDSNNQNFYYRDGETYTWTETVTTEQVQDTDENGNPLYDGDNNPIMVDKETIQYSEIEYTPCVETTKAYVFKISETKGTEVYITDWDESEHYLKVVTIAPANDEEMVKGTRLEVTTGVKAKGESEITWGEATTNYGIDTKDTPLKVNVGTFNNKADDVVLPEGTINVKKVLDGRSWITTDKFQFTLEASDNSTPMPTDSQVSGDRLLSELVIDTTDTKIDADASSYKDSKGFGEIKFTGAHMVDGSGAPVNEKTFTYFITEKVPADDEKVAGMTYSSQRYAVKVTVKKEAGELKITKTETLPVIDGTNGSAVDIATFTNTYDVEPVEVDPPVKKVVEGTDAKDPFTYTFKPVSNTANIAVEDMPMPEGSTGGQKQITKDGAGEYEFGVFELSVPGTYVYEITEEVGTLNYDYDTSKYTVTYVVTANGNKLEATTTITKDGEASETALFTNKYKGDGEATGDETYGGKNETQTGKPNYNVNPSNPVTPKGLKDPTTGELAETVNIPGEGTYTLNEDGSITFKPEVDYVGDPTPIEVVGTDKQGTEVSATYTPHVVDNEETKTVGRTIKYQYSDGTPVANGEYDKEEAVTFVRTGTVDPKTGEVTFPDSWEVLEGDEKLEAVNSPELDGWTPDKEKVDAVTLKPTDSDIEEVVTYNPEDVTAEPDISYGLAGRTQKGKVSFKSGTSKLPDGSENKLTLKLRDPATNELVDEVTIPGQGTYKLSQDGTVEFTPEDGFVGTPDPIRVTATDMLGKVAATTYAPHVVDPTDSRVVKRVIKFRYDSKTGEGVIEEDIVQEKTMIRHAAEVDAKTGAVLAWGPWEPVTFPAVPNPDSEAKEGYSTKDIAGELTITEPTELPEEYVIYVKTEPSKEEVPVKPVEPDKPVAPGADTGDRNNIALWITLFVVTLLLMVAVWARSKVRRKN